MFTDMLLLESERYIYISQQNEWSFFLGPLGPLIEYLRLLSIRVFHK